MCAFAGCDPTGDASFGWVVPVLAVVAHLVDAGGEVDGVRTLAAVEDIYRSVVRPAVRASAHDVVSLASEDLVLSEIALDPVVVHLPINLVVAFLPPDKVFTRVAPRPVIARSGEDPVVLGTADQPVVHVGARALAPAHDRC